MRGTYEMAFELIKNFFKNKKDTSFMKETMEVSDAAWEIRNDPLKNFDPIFKLYAEKGVPLALLNYGVSLLKRGQLEESIYWFKKASDKRIDLSKYYLGIIYNSLGENEKSNFYLELAAPEIKDALVVLALKHYMKDDIQAAISLLLIAKNEGSILAKRIYNALDDVNNEQMLRFLFPMAKVGMIDSINYEYLKIPFKNPEGAFKYACEYMNFPEQKGQYTFGIVEDGTMFGWDTPVKTDQENIQIAILRLPSKDGGEIVCSKVKSQNGSKLKLNDMVVWMYEGEEHKQNNGNKFKKNGLIVAKLDPIIFLAPRGLEWEIDERFED